MVEIWKIMEKFKKNGVINLFMVNQSIIIHLESERKYYDKIFWYFELNFTIQLTEERMMEIWKKMEKFKKMELSIYSSLMNQ